MIARVALVGSGGMIGAILRYAGGGLAHKFYEGRFPLGTLLVNTVGCLAIGFLFTLSDDRAIMSAHARLFLFAGLLGGFTTFSAFGYETLSLWRDGMATRALVNVAANTVLALVAVWAGQVLAHTIPGS